MLSFQTKTRPEGTMRVLNENDLPAAEAHDLAGTVDVCKVCKAYCRLEVSKRTVYSAFVDAREPEAKPVVRDHGSHCRCSYCKSEDGWWDV
jgi:hypothetical protein